MCIEHVSMNSSRLTNVHLKGEGALGWD
jgi:hypothetical protein